MAAPAARVGSVSRAAPADRAARVPAWAPPRRAATVAMAAPVATRAAAGPDPVGFPWESCAPLVRSPPRRATRSAAGPAARVALEDFAATDSPRRPAPPEPFQRRSCRSLTNRWTIAPLDDSSGGAIFLSDDERRVYGQSTSGLKGANRPLGFGLPIHTCRLQCGAGIGVPPTSNAWPSNVGAG